MLGTPVRKPRRSIDSPSSSADRILGAFVTNRRARIALAVLPVLLCCGKKSLTERRVDLCARYEGMPGDPVDRGWCEDWLSSWPTHDHRRSEKCLSRASSRLEIRLCEFQDEEGVTAYPFARRECALAAKTMEAFDACAQKAPTEAERPFEAVGPRAVQVPPTTFLGLLHRDESWHALVMEPSFAVRSHDDVTSLVLVRIGPEGLGEEVLRSTPPHLDAHGTIIMVGDTHVVYAPREGQPASVRAIQIDAAAQPEILLELAKDQRIVAHALRGGAQPEGVIITQRHGPPYTPEGGDDDPREVVPWLPEFEVQVLGGETRSLVEYTEDEASGSNILFPRSAVFHEGAPLAVAWTGPHNKKRPLHVVIFDDDGSEAFHTEIEGFEAVLSASTSDGIVTVVAKPTYVAARDMTVFRFSTEGEVGERRRFNWRWPSYATAIACRERLALVRPDGGDQRPDGHAFADYWDLSGRDNLDLPERIWFGGDLTNQEISAGCHGNVPAVVLFGAQQPHEGTLGISAADPRYMVFMTVP